MNKKVINISLFLIICLLIAITNNSIDITVDQNVCNYLQSIGITDMKIKQNNNYMNTTYKKIKKTVTRKDVDEFIHNDLESYNEIVDVTDRDFVIEGDFISVDYKVYCNSKMVNEVENGTFVVGKNIYNEQIEDNVLGKKKGTEFEFMITVPKDDPNVKLAGKEEVVKMTISSIQRIVTKELTDQFVKDNYGLETVDEYYNYVNKKIYEDNKVMSIHEENNEILTDIIDCFDIQLNEDEVAKYSLDIVNKYKQMAEIYSCTFEEYMVDYINVSEKNIYDYCYNEGERIIKKYIVLGVIANKEKIIIDNKDDAKYEAEEYISVLEEKVLEYLRDNLSYTMEEKE